MKRRILYGLLMLALLLPGTATAQDEATIRIPALEVESSLIEFRLGYSTWRISSWATKIGHLEGTGWFGVSGNVVLAGHAELPGRRPGIFAALETLIPGDEIFVHADGVDYRYGVTAVSNVSMYDTSVIAPTENQVLTLITCDSASFDPQHQLYDRRVVIRAVRA